MEYMPYSSALSLIEKTWQKLGHSGKRFDSAFRQALKSKPHYKFSIWYKKLAPYIKKEKSKNELKYELFIADSKIDAERKNKAAKLEQSEKKVFKDREPYWKKF